MKNLMIKFCIFMISSCAFGSGTALIYRGPGACRGCPETVGALLHKMGISVRYIGPNDFSELTFQNAKLYIQPGGTGNSSIETLKALKPIQIQYLRNFIFRGGRYLGICAGGYLAGRFWDERRGIKAFGLLPVTIDPEPVGTFAQLISVNWRGNLRKMYFLYGPYFDFQSIPGARVWAVYASSGHAAALMAPFGTGRVGVIGPHPEATQYWFQLSHLVPVDGLSLDLAEDFVRALIRN